MFGDFLGLYFRDGFENEETCILSRNLQRTVPIARFYTRGEWQQTVRGLFEVDSVKIYGLKSDVVPLPYNRFKLFLENLVPDRVARILTHRLRGGTFLVAQMRTLKSE